jgi:hypothetical protein
VTRNRWRGLRCLLRAVVLGTILAVVGGGCGSAAKLGAAALLQQAKSLQSRASEGALLAEDATAGKTTSNYTREHASDLYEAASRDLASLKTAKTKPGLEPKLRRLTALATRVSTELERLGGASRDDRRKLGRELQAAARESQKIGEGLN